MLTLDEVQSRMILLFTGDVRDHFSFTWFISARLVRQQQPLCSGFEADFFSANTKVETTMQYAANAQSNDEYSLTLDPSSASTLFAQRIFHRQSCLIFGMRVLSCATIALSCQWTFVYQDVPHRPRIHCIGLVF